MVYEPGSQKEDEGAAQRTHPWPRNSFGQYGEQPKKTQDRLDWHETGPLGGFSKNVCLDMIEHLKKQLGESDSAIESWKRFLRLRGITWVEGGK